MKERLDVLLVQQGYATSREKAKAIIMAGQVYVDGQKEDKAGSMFKEEAKIEVRGNTLKYVSRGGLKLEKAMSHFAVTLEGKVCMDVGASTGGFTDWMLPERSCESLLRGCGPWPAGLEASKRSAGSLHGKDQHPLCDTGGYSGARRHFPPIDVSFISLTKVLLPVRNLLTEDGEAGLAASNLSLRPAGR